ncbi:MAG: hypothetical protein GXY54_07650 [Deltaproteobacteria bacterium]|nr:hypothetical protein [Deltaproteobacteria bacterium]
MAELLAFGFLSVTFVNFYHIADNKETAAERGGNSLDKKRALPVKFSEIFPFPSPASRRLFFRRAPEIVG